MELTESDLILKSKYNIEIKNAFDALHNTDLDDNIQNEYDVFVKLVNETNNKILPIIKSKKHQWVSDATESLIIQRQDARKKFNQSNSVEDHLIWRELAKASKKSFANDNWIITFEYVII